nr:MAG TPA: Major capsid protein [Microviridae sp.]
MTVVRTLGKNTLGDNNKMKVAMRDYDMSTHDISNDSRKNLR